jgi:hypothetical protein
VEPSRFWLRRNDDDRARQVVYDEVQLNHYSDRQRRAILKVMARGKTASHRDIRQAARRARSRPRGETVVAITLVLSVLAVLIIFVVGRHRDPSKAVVTGATASAHTSNDRASAAAAGDLTTVIDKADRAWLSDVGAGKVVSANDGSDALALPQTEPRSAITENASARPAQVASDPSSR